MKAIAAERRRFGYRRLHVMLQREGFEVNEKKTRRLYSEEKLQVKRRGGTKTCPEQTPAYADANGPKSTVEFRLRS